MTDDRARRVSQLRWRQPEAIRQAAERRVRRAPGSRGEMVVVIAADHPARGALRVGADPLAMADRSDLVDRVLVALRRPGVDGILATADLIEDLLAVSVLEQDPVLDGKLVIGSMNRGGLAGTVFELDDRFTGYTPAAIERFGLDGGKMLLRIDPEDPATASTLEACGRAVSELAERQLIAMVEVFLSHRVGTRTRNDLSPEAVIRSMAVASGLGSTSAYTWLKVPVVEEMERVMRASLLPVVILGGEVSPDPDAALARWGAALRLPNVCGAAMGRSLLYPAGGDVAQAVDRVVERIRAASDGVPRGEGAGP